MVVEIFIPVIIIVILFLFVLGFIAYIFKSDKSVDINCRFHSGLQNVLILSENEEFVARGKTCSIIKWIGVWKPDASDKILKFSNQLSAILATKKHGLGFEPLFHEAHEPEKQDHYHIHGHNYIRYDKNPDKLLNFRFCYGPRTTVEEFESRRFRE